MIQVRDLVYRYPGNNVNTLKGLNFSIKKGEIFGFLGPSGAGKSTTQKILIGILKNYQGNVIVQGTELNTVRSDYYEKIGIAFEFPNFYSRFTALENLSFFRSLYAYDTEEPQELLKRVGLENHGNTKVASLSKGMKTRLNLCRSLLNRPEILFLDEPTSGLDPTNSRMVKDILLEKKDQGKTIIITTHHMNVAEEICDRVAFIVDGQICLIDSPRELKLRQGKKSLKVEYKEEYMVKTAEFPLKKIGENRDFLELIQKKKIETMHTQETTLEQIFINVTGRSLS
ncbi:ABC transporter ATP-binding protein [Thermoflavimicrobium daqui]|uniref:ABC transporter ATP-binding protein n=1 Tax=Thermoflavimicrobium daqui TaxID=2137476 RepID=A0A364K2R4_9BACL|nr:ABC transporter ATP-binding protein [Thermoflavimicrobium daqui]RAL22599.1 ABC transporter ATP-binding protein [Thermoflavimicrobium daqui]